MDHLNPNQFKEANPRYRVYETDMGHSIWDREEQKDVGGSTGLSNLGLKQPRKPHGIANKGVSNEPGEYKKFLYALHSKVDDLNSKNVGRARNFKKQF
jgi:hypothetical protein